MVQKSSHKKSKPSRGKFPRSGLRNLPVAEAIERARENVCIFCSAPTQSCFSNVVPYLGPLYLLCRACQEKAELLPSGCIWCGGSTRDAWEYDEVCKKCTAILLEILKSLRPQREATR